MIRQGIKIIITLLFLVNVLAVPSKAEQVGLLPIPVLENVTVEAQVTFDSATGLYTYSYSVSNPATNTGEIWAIEIDITWPRNTVSLSGDGLTLPIGPTTKTFNEEIDSYSSFATLNPELMVPIGQRVPVGWDGGIGIAGYADFTSESKNDHILPGNAQSGFEIISRGLPAIRDADILPKWLLLVDSLEDITKEEEQRAREIKQEIRFKAKTIGPTAPPESSKKVVEMIQGYIDESVILNWLMDSALANNLRNKLNAVLQFIEAGDLSSAITTMDEFINLVDQSTSSQMTSEAKGLLFNNGDYLKNLLISPQ